MKINRQKNRHREIQKNDDDDGDDDDIDDDDANHTSFINHTFREQHGPILQISFNHFTYRTD